MDQKYTLLLQRYKQIRGFSKQIVSPLEVEDFVIQSIPDVSPPKWHLAHTTWFFETFILIPYADHYDRFNDKYDYLFNSYYETHGKPYPRHARGLLARPSVNEIIKYREYVDGHISDLLEDGSEELCKQIEPILEIGLHHEQQHQELLITDIKYNFFINPLRPAYHDQKNVSYHPVPRFDWIHFEEGIVETGHSAKGFSFDNERPVHKSWVDDFAIANRPVTNGEFIHFINEGGYEKPEFWLSEGWSIVKEEQWKSPLYWEKNEGDWYTFTLTGMQKVNENEPVTHISFYEADAYARWAGFRLPTETEWEHAMKDASLQGNMADRSLFHPNDQYENSDSNFYKTYGDVWEWTSSPYVPYPRSKPLEGTLGEYNAKFMCNQMVLRGGSCATHSTHMRLTYRNFFHPGKRWQFSGLRLAKDL
ncbi:ergothioneine biosynthesis protein EgtB [Pseudalkalibacillus berkeleyi]|uniref:Ergothioneine biosynthesis protein EgtB n=1 Tax=Pseudalkalibacillus berkeleyi TaxID=1069813 RepID=A0ABS9H122_9BACL|nr:ergothioneine biosynthesis protein EgtB [Pseudalkalibacillus berkeleyi]MCF6137350.1 ergothioneine biosynthesis protein EgtB [Pseudalkalibacillus berkeleyi]